MNMGAELSIGWILAVFSFAVVLIITPGPNNIMLTSAGASFGFRKTIPHILGVALGSPVLLFVVAAGGLYLFQFELVRYLFRICSIAYFLYLAFKIAVAKPNSEKIKARPFTFIQAVGFQWLNPKIWSQYVILLGVYIGMGNNFLIEIITAAFIFLFVGIISCCLWTIFGTVLSRFLMTPRHYRYFNMVMAALLIVTVLPVLLGHFDFHTLPK